MVGAGLPKDLRGKVDTRITNVAPRKILGVDGTATIELVHLVAGTYMYGNLVVMHFAEQHFLALRADNSDIKYSIEEELWVM